MAITAKINPRPNVVGSVSQGNQVQVTKVTSTATKVTQLTDVDLSEVTDGSFLQYNGERKVFVTTTSISGAVF
jgi:hypothetical protein